MKDKIKTVSLIGLGFIGIQIARRLGDYDFNLHFFDKSEEARKKMKSVANRILRLQKKKGFSNQIILHDNLEEAIKDTDLIIEAIPENLELKKEIFTRIDEGAPEYAIIATNSSSIPVSRIEDAVKRKEKVLNLHFYAPVWTRSMADIMKGTETSDETFQKGMEFLKEIECYPLIVKKESMGFVFNRIWHAIKKECLKIWAQGVADIQTVDEAWKIWSGMGMGPFKMMDGVGLDTVYDIEMQYYEESSLESDKPPEKLKKMVEERKLGTKSGGGFY